MAAWYNRGHCSHGNDRYYHASNSGGSRETNYYSCGTKETVYHSPSGHVRARYVNGGRVD